MLVVLLQNSIKKSNCSMSFFTQNQPFLSLFLTLFGFLFHFDELFNLKLVLVPFPLGIFTFCFSCAFPPPYLFSRFWSFFLKSVLQFYHFFQKCSSTFRNISSKWNNIRGTCGMLVDKLINTARFLLFPNLATLSMGEYLKTFLTGENETRDLTSLYL